MVRAAKDRFVDAVSAPEERRARPRKIQWALVIGIIAVALTAWGQVYARVQERAKVDAVIEQIPELKDRVLAVEIYIPDAARERAILKQRNDEQDRRLQTIEDGLRALQGVPETMRRLDAWLDKQH